MSGKKGIKVKKLVGADLMTLIAFLPPPQALETPMSFPADQEGFMQRIERRRAEREEARRNAPKPKTLSEQITDWYESLSPAEKKAAYSLKFLCRQFDSTPQKISELLWQEGWERVRDWETGKPHSRVWQKKTELP